ncbi:hypothetical protein EV401DRAFT_1407934 [Pisolithus croceorrhizus]|nr:hypothetical protein EV401DRAFT_1407934 [Pisolithus croceorrhizus]
MKSKGRVWQPGNEPITFFPHLPRCSLLRHCHTIKHPTQLPSKSQDGHTSENNVNSGSPAFRYLSIVGVANAPTPPAQSRHPESSIPTRYVNHRATAFTLKEELISFTLPKTDLLTKYNFAASADELPSTPKPVFVAELRSHATYTHICTHRLHPVPLAPKEAKERDTSPSSPLIECRSAADSPEQHNADRRQYVVAKALE